MVGTFGLTVNGVERTVEDARLNESLLYVLRERLGLPGAKDACEQGECGSCSVLLDGELVCSCLELAATAAGCEVTTVEGLAPPGAEPAEGMVWGRTLRSPHAHARIRSIDVGPALALPGVVCVLTAADVPGTATYGLIEADQPVLAADVVRYEGEAVAAVAADHPDIAGLAAAAIVVDYEPLPPLTDAAAALRRGMPDIHPDGNVVRQISIRHGDADATGDVMVEGTYEVGAQDQAFLGPESGLAVPDDEGGVDLWIATQWLHHDRDQVAACLGLPPEKVRLHLGGVGGAFGAREDISLQVHACLLALRSGRPVKMSYPREESFVGHVHRHPARMRYRHHATAEGDLVKVEAEILLDGGAYASSSPAVVGNAARMAAGPYRVPNAVIDATVVRTNNPPCGAMRGFGAVQVCFAHESQMDRLASTLGLDPVELRLRNALEPGDVLPTGQVLKGPAPVAECIRAAAAHPLPDSPLDARPPGRGNGAGATTVSESSWLALPGGVGRTADPRRVRRGVGFAVSFENLLDSEGFDDTSAVHHHCRTHPLDEQGQGDAAVGYVFAAHRAVVDVDVDLGLVRVVQVATEQDVGRVLHPVQVLGQIEGGIAQGAGLAVMEELVLEDGLVRNPSFTDDLIPTVADEPEVLATCIEQPEPEPPSGAKSVGEPPTISSTPAVVAAIRSASGVDVARVPVRPWDLV